MLKLVAFAALAVLCLECEAKYFDRCGLVTELRRQKFPENNMREWVCLVEHESNRYTDKTSNNENGSRNYGLFQIDDQFWCSNNNTPGKDCHVTCADLLTDDITKAAQCALYIYRRQGFSAWDEWRSHCQTANSLPDIRSC